MYAPSRPSDRTTASVGESEVNSSTAVNRRERRDMSNVDSRTAPFAIVISSPWLLLLLLLFDTLGLEAGFVRDHLRNCGGVRLRRVVRHFSVLVGVARL